MFILFFITEKREKNEKPLREIWMRRMNAGVCGFIIMIEVENYVNVMKRTAEKKLKNEEENLQCYKKLTLS